MHGVPTGQWEPRSWVLMMGLALYSSCSPASGFIQTGVIGLHQLVALVPPGTS